MATKEKRQEQKDNEEMLEVATDKRNQHFRKQERIDDEVKGVVQLKDYDENSLDIFGYELETVMDDLLLVDYVDETTNGEITRGGIIVPTQALNKDKSPWRIGKVILSGPTAQYYKTGDFIVFPNDKGLKVSNIDIAGFDKPFKKVVFLNESRVFGRVKPKQYT